MQNKLRTLILIAMISVAAVAGEQPQTQLQITITVKELPPEAIPAGTCKESYSGYLEVQERGKVEDVNLTSQQIGDYVKKRLSAGYSLSLYPQASGRWPAPISNPRLKPA